MTNFIQRWLSARAGSPGSAGGAASKRASRGAGRALAALGLALALFPALPAWAADTLNWETNRNLVSADIKSGKLLPVLERIAAATGWHIFLEPDTTCAVSAKFDRLPPGEALHLLLHDLNFALVPATNASPKLFVFRTAMQNATQSVHPARPVASDKGKLIPNQLIVRLKPGVKIDDLAKLLGAKVTGRIDSLNAYLLQFEDQAAADAARQQLASNPDVASVDSNYSIDRPAVPAAAQGANLPPPTQLQLKAPPADTSRIIVGLVDTGLQPLGNGLDSFLLPAVSVAGQAQPDPNNPTHGTSMAQTMLRSISTMTKGSSSVKILPVDIYGPNASTTSFDAANGVVTAYNNGAKVINMSFGSAGDSPLLQSVIQQVSAGNVLLIAAAGNQPVPTPFYPAAYPQVMAVTAIDQGRLDSYASCGGFVTLGASGNSIVYYKNQPWIVQGTSASSADVSGIAAGHMETTDDGVNQTQTYLLNNYGVTIVPSN